MIDQFTIDRIQAAAQIVDVVSDFVTLRRRGVNFLGLCPFHEDKTPSFSVSPSKNICKCFSCGEGGTPLHFVMKHEQLSYVEALKYLAKKYGIEVQEKELTNEEKQHQSDRESMFILNAYAQKSFTSNLFEHVEGKSIGMSYFRERGFREDIIQKFQLGYCLEQRDAFSKQATGAGYKQEFLEKTGLSIAYENGRMMDRFWGRVMFPVHSLSGKVVAFGGRILKKDTKTAKYVNSPESEIYHKSNELYGIYFARQAMVKHDRCFLVEGYTDVISMHQSGIENVVASSGTALTKGQIRLIHRFTTNVTVLYDGDAAGIKAALRGIDLLLEEGLNIKVVLLPEGEDPDSFARQQNATSFIQYIQDNQSDFIQFKTRLLLAESGGDPIKRANLITDVVSSIAIIPEEIIRSVYIRECSAILEIDEKTLMNGVVKKRMAYLEQKKTVQYPADVQGTVSSTSTENISSDTSPEGISAPFNAPPASEAQAVYPFDAYELELLRYVIRYGEQLLYTAKDEETQETRQVKVVEHIVDDLRLDDLDFLNPLHKQILDEALAKSLDASFKAKEYFKYHPDSAISKLAFQLADDKYDLSKYHSRYQKIEEESERLNDLIPYNLTALKDAMLKQQIAEINLSIKKLQEQKDLEKLPELLQRLSKLKEIQKISSQKLGERILLRM
ncbi:MAG: DNA primase [Dysgonamonadaceae bacterium]|nr:DNA primase [Dysgonamonadaceae bacterium]